jgi:hypothetical protein
MTGVRVRAVDLALRVVRRAYGYVDATAAGVALGVMDRRHLHALDRLYYDRAASYHGEAHNLRGLFPWEEAAVEGWFGGCRSLVVVGAGGGREVLALSRRGFEVDGYECNARLVEVAGALLPAQGCTARVLPLERDAVPPPERRYDGLMAGWSAYMLIPGRAARIRFLRGMAALAEPGAPLLLSFFTRSADAPRFKRIAAVAGPLRRLRRAEPVDEGDDLTPNYVHRFTEAEVRREMDAGGFDLVRYQPEGRTGYDSGWAVGRLR